MLTSDKAANKSLLCPSAEHILIHLRDFEQLPLAEPRLEGVDPAVVESSVQASIDMLEVADMIGARQFSVVYDQRRYPTQSVFNPTLADLQGPSLMIAFDMALSVDEVVRLQQARFACFCCSCTSIYRAASLFVGFRSNI